MRRFLSEISPQQIARLVLAGVALSYLLQGATSYLQLRARPDQLSGVLFWLLGSVSGAQWQDLGLPAALVVSCTAWLLLPSLVSVYALIRIAWQWRENRVRTRCLLVATTGSMGAAVRLSAAALLLLEKSRLRTGRRSSGGQHYLERRRRVLRVVK